MSDTYDLAKVVLSVITEKKKDPNVEKAIEIALSMSGDMTGAVKKIEKIQRGLSKNKAVADALKLANESVEVEEATKSSGTGNERLHRWDDINGAMMDIGYSARVISKLLMALNARTKKRGTKLYAEGTEEVTEATTIDIDFDAPKGREASLGRKYKVKIKRTSDSTADVTGDEKDILKFLRSKDYGMDDRDIKDFFPQLLEATTIDIDFDAPKGRENALGKKYKVKIKRTSGSTADVTGDEKNILKFLRSKDYGMDDIDIKAFFPQLLEATTKSTSKDPLVEAYDDSAGNRMMLVGMANLSTMMNIHGVDPKYQKQLAAKVIKAGVGKQVVIPESMRKDRIAQDKADGYDKVNKVAFALSKWHLEHMNESTEVITEGKKEEYQKVFNAALKKFGVKSPAELKGDKKKEFFDYVDANYEAENESD